MKVRVPKFVLIGAMAVAAGSASALVLVSSSAPPQTKGPVNDARTFKPDSKKIGECKKVDIQCFAQAYGNLAYQQGPAVAIARLVQGIETGVMQEATCHEVVHGIGLASLASPKADKNSILAAGSGMCTGGYYHGVLEALFIGKSPTEVLALATTLCDAKEIVRLAQLSNCAHGVGHGSMVYNAYEVKPALQICNALPQAQHAACADGVFMEKFAPERDGTRVAAKTSADAIEVCRAAQTAFKHECYFEVVGLIVRREHSGDAAIFKACARSEADWERSCVGAVGNFAATRSARKGDPVAALKTCRHAMRFQDRCVAGAAAQLGSMFGGSKEAVQMCNAAPVTTRQACLLSLGDVLGAAFADARARKECKRAGAGFTDCWRGVTDLRARMGAQSAA